MDDVAGTPDGRSGTGVGHGAYHGAGELRPTRPEARGEHLVWHQELICPGEPCRGRVRTFPPGVLIDDGRRERRRCPMCGTAVAAPAFYVGESAHGPRARRTAEADSAHAGRRIPEIDRGRPRPAPRDESAASE